MKTAEEFIEFLEKENQKVNSRSDTAFIFDNFKNLQYNIYIKE